ncbi:hypothetical protein ACFLZW_01300 [Chloroflexota bacterium]
MAAVSAPRIAAIERPFGCTVGEPGDSASQMAVLRATLQALVEIKTPGEIRHLPFDYVEPTGKANQKHDPPPIAKHLAKRPWQISNLINRKVPA